MTELVCSWAHPRRRALCLKFHSLQGKFTSAGSFPSLSVFKDTLALLFFFFLFYEFESHLPSSMKNAIRFLLGLH